jgi:hypothetical protein
MLPEIIVAGAAAKSGHAVFFDKISRHPERSEGSLYLSLLLHVVRTRDLLRPPTRSGKSCQPPTTTKPEPTATFRLSY